MKTKQANQKGKIRFSEYFKTLKEGETVALVEELSFPHGYPKRMIGKTGIITGTRGVCKIVKLNDGNFSKTFIVHPIHLKKIKR